MAENLQQVSILQDDQELWKEAYKQVQEKLDETNLYQYEVLHEVLQHYVECEEDVSSGDPDE